MVLQLDLWMQLLQTKIPKNIKLPVVRASGLISPDLVYSLGERYTLDLPRCGRMAKISPFVWST